MIWNTLTLTVVLIGITYAAFYLKRIWSTSSIQVSQTIQSEDTTVTPSEKKSRQPKEIKLSILLLVYLAVLLGMLTTAIYRDIKTSGAVSYNKFRVDFLLSAIVSPLVLQGVLSTYPDLHKLRWYNLLLIAYQNGFFWQTIFGEIANKL